MFAVFYDEIYYFLYQEAGCVVRSKTKTTEGMANSIINEVCLIESMNYAPCKSGKFIEFFADFEVLF